MAVAVEVAITMVAAVEVGGLQPVLPLQASQRLPLSRETAPSSEHCSVPLLTITTTEIPRRLVRKSEAIRDYDPGLCGQPLIKDDNGSLPHPPA
jgi:hypothetical protein